MRPRSGRMMDVALTKPERPKADDLIQRLLDLVDDGYLAARAAIWIALVGAAEKPAICGSVVQRPVPVPLRSTSNRIRRRPARAAHPCRT
jgi:hypothetical protein